MQILAVPFTAILIAGLMPLFLDLVEILGHRIPQKDISNDFLKGVMVATILTTINFFLPFPKEDKKNIYLVWGVKLLVTLVIMLGYEWNYGLDAYYYFEESQRLYSDFSQVGFSKGTENLIALLWYTEHEIFQTASYHSIKVVISYIGMLGIYTFYLGVKSYFPKVSPSLFLLIALFPSNLFWTSILGKDPLNLFGICLASYGIIGLLSRKRSIIHPIALVLGLAIVAAFRAWVIGGLIVPVIFSSISLIQNRLYRMGSIAAGILTLVLLAQPILASINSEQAAEAVQSVDAVSKSWQRGGSAGEVPHFSSPWEMLRFLPFGMFTALFRPLPGEVLNLFGIMAGLENVFLLYLFYMAYKHNRKKFFTPLNIWLLGYILIWATLYAFISPQNMGAAVRFRTQVLPAMLLLALSARGSFRLLNASNEE